MLDENQELQQQEEKNPAEEIANEEVKDTTEQLLPSTSEPVLKPNKDTPPYDEAIEKARAEFTKKFKKGRISSFIAMGVVVLLAVGSVVCMGFRKMPLTIVGWSLVGVAIVGMLVYYLVTRNILPDATKEYIKVVNDNLNMRNFMDNKFTDVTVDPKEKIELADPVSDAIYVALTNIASRNVINGHFQGRTFKVADLGLYSGQGRSRTSAFVGKYISFVNDLHFEGRYIVNVKAETPVDLPSDIEDLVVITQEDYLTIYGKEGNKPSSDLGKDFLKLLREIKLDKYLLDLNIVIWSGHTAVYASYSDEIMTLPFEKDFNKEPNENYAEDLIRLFDILNLLVKKEK